MALWRSSFPIDILFVPTLLECLIIPLLFLPAWRFNIQFLAPSFLEGVQSITINRASHIKTVFFFCFLLNSWLIPWLHSLYRDYFQYFFAWLPPPVSVVLQYILCWWKLPILTTSKHVQGVLQKLAQKGQTHMSPKLACQVARNVACGLGLLHSKGIVHRDVKSSNVLIDLDSTEGPDGGPLVKLCDFDSAVPLSSSSAHTCYLAHRGVPPVDVCVGTPRWLAPEVLRAMYGRHSYGLVSFPICTLRPIFWG